jgi:hypothetical protein
MMFRGRNVAANPVGFLSCTVFWPKWSLHDCHNFKTELKRFYFIRQFELKKQYIIASKYEQINNLYN